MTTSLSCKRLILFYYLGAFTFFLFTLALCPIPKDCNSPKNKCAPNSSGKKASTMKLVIVFPTSIDNQRQNTAD